MAETPNEQWHPSVPPVTEEDLKQCPVVVVHYWAIWNLHDRTENARLLPLRQEYDGRICFRACDVDCAANQRFVHGVANIPALGFFVREKWVKSVIGMRPPEQLRLAFDELLASAAGGPPVKGSTGNGMLSVIRRLISRQRGSG